MGDTGGGGKTQSISSSWNSFRQIQNNRQCAVRPDSNLRQILSLIIDYSLKACRSTSVLQ